ncbi:hypothetical protein M422DRAFT_132947, partial [Sphaerobolus stellatus SS14]
VGICPGFDFGIGNVIHGGNGISRWNIYNNNCTIVDGLTTNENPCISGIFSCSPAPVHFTEYINTYNSRVYLCQTGSSFGICGNDAISVCVR